MKTDVLYILTITDHPAPPSKVQVFRVYKCTLHKMHNSGLKNPKKCNIWHLPAKFGSTVACV